MDKSIGILYICTGPYYLFWEDFYKSFQEKFLRNTKKKYFVFTDADHIYSEDSENVRLIKIDNQPWPLITLLRFNTFLSIEPELKKCDYLMFSNANIICDEIITEEEFLPKDGEDLFVTSHPGYSGKKIYEFPYERNPNSLAYIPWNCGKDYVIGAMFGGTSQGFVQMSKALKSNIEEDLKKNIIAKWHDESHLNRYVAGRNGVRVLSPEYCYPYGMNVDYDKKISAVSKQAKFDVKTFKGHYEVKRNPLRRFLGSVKRSMLVKEKLHYFFDKVVNKHIKEI